MSSRSVGLCLVILVAVLVVVLNGIRSWKNNLHTNKPAQVRLPVLRDVTDQTGITFVHSDGSTGERFIVETVSAGVAIFDYDGDGWQDIYLLSGVPLRDGGAVSQTSSNRLYRNLSGWSFVDVTAEAGLTDTSYSLGVAAADYDSDGDLDLYVTNYGPNTLFRNNGDGTFSDVTEDAGVMASRDVGAGTCFFDFDADGDLDLYAASYLKFSVDDNRKLTINDVPVYAGPDQYTPVPDVLYENRGDGTFRDVSEASGIAGHTSWGMGVVAADYDNDRDADVYVSNDVGASFLWRNDGTGRFEEVGLEAGVSHDVFGSAQGSMGVDCADYNNDGHLDFYQTSFQLQHAILYKNLGGGFFEDVTHTTRAGIGTFENVTWGVGFVDFNNDGYRDVYVACGHLQDNLAKFDRNGSYRAQDLLLLNDGNDKFSEVFAEAMGGSQTLHSSRGAAFDDLDRDGNVDTVVLNSRERPTILKTKTDVTQRWTRVTLVGNASNRTGVGTRVVCKTGVLAQYAEVHSGRGYQSSFGLSLHFGLGNATIIDRIEVHWLGRGVDVFESLPVNCELVIREGAGYCDVHATK